MGKYLFPHLTDEFAAVVSTHGYFEIQEAESYNSYASSAVKGGAVWRTNEDGSRTRCPDPVVVHQGVVEDLGLRYRPEVDDLADEDDDADVIRSALLRYLEAKA